MPDIEQNLNMNEVVIISQAFHHIEKGIYIKENIFSGAEIINIYKNKEKLEAHKAKFKQKFINHYDCFTKININRNSKRNTYIFFSFSPSLPLIKFIHTLRKNKKKIILIQDNHQYSVHKGSVNSILLRPDIIISASDLEKKFIVNNLGYPDNIVISNGWIFRNLKDNSKKIKTKKNNNNNNEKNLLIAFSAPPDITLLSNESYLIRHQIILWAKDQFPKYNILLKLHPHENIDKFKNFTKKHNLNHKLVPSQTSVNECIINSDVVICSNETQIALDVISSDISKELIIYSFKKNNFLNKSSIFYDKKTITKDHDIEFGLIDNKKKQQIKKEHLIKSYTLKESVHHKILELYSQKDDKNLLIDIYLWLFIYDMPDMIVDYLKNNPSKKNLNVLNLILNKNFSLNHLVEDFKDKRITDPLCIIVIRYYLNNFYLIDEKKISVIVDNNFNEYLCQYFFRDLIRFNNLNLSKNINFAFSKKYIILINKIEKLYESKFQLFKIYFFVLKKLYKLKVKPLSKFIFFITDKIFRV